MTSPITYELRIQFLNVNTINRERIKESVKNWLIGFGEETFVEGCVDDIDLAYDYEDPDLDYYAKLGGNESAISIFRYDVEYLQNLKQMIEEAFGDQISCSNHSADTAEWQEGWKESFKPFQTRSFFVYPPWEKEAARSIENLHMLEIEPGMAFGTGQHATTQLCLQALENLPLTDSKTPARRVLDVGTGTGILAIAMQKLGFSDITATDIDPDAVKAAQENSARNNSPCIQIEKGSIPPHFLKSPADLVIANILFVVIRRLLSHLSQATAPGGYLLLSGVLNEEISELIALCQAQQLDKVRTFEKDDWVAVLLKKKEEKVHGKA